MNFEFTIPGMTKKQADSLLNIIVTIVEALGLSVVGGYVKEKTKRMSKR